MSTATTDRSIDDIDGATIGVPGSAHWWDEHAARLGRRRPRSGGLTVEQIVDAALDLADAEGYDALTVRNLATRLGTSSATLYRHIASVDELLVLVVDRVLAEVDLPDPSLDGRARVVSLSHEFRRVLLHHPGVLPALRAAPLLGPNARRSAESGLDNLLAMGLARPVAVSAYLAMVDFVLGSVFFDAASAAHRLDARHIDTDHVFSFAIETFLDGLTRRT